MKENNLNEEVLDNQNVESSDFFDDDLLTEWEWVESIEKLRHKKRKNWIINKIVMFFIFIFAILAFLLYNINFFFTLSLKWNNIEWFEKEYVDFVTNNILVYFTNNTNAITFDNMNTKDFAKRAVDMDDYISNPSIMFFQKNYEKWDFVTKEINLYKKQQQTIDDIKKQIVHYKFIPKEIDNLMKDIRILPILYTLNSINIYMIDYVYMQIWKFNKDIFMHVLKRSNMAQEFPYIKASQLANFVSEDIQKMWESWVSFYLKNLKFNYMYSEWDSDSFVNNYYINAFSENFSNVLNKRIEFLESMEWSNIKGNTAEIEKFKLHYINFIKDIYARTNQLFENQDINTLPVSVSLLSYDPQTQMLSFNVQISLEDQDNSKVSVIKIATDLVSLLRKSRLVIWSDISIKDIKVKQTNKMIWWTKMLYHETDLLFKTYVQSDNNIEVSDSEK